MKKGYLFLILLGIVIVAYAKGSEYYETRRAGLEVIDHSAQRYQYQSTQNTRSNRPNPPMNLRAGQMVSLSGGCDLLYEVPIRVPLEIRHRIGEMPGDRRAMVMMEPEYLDDIDMWFVKVDTGFDIFGWVPISCINGVVE